eukprot:199560-Rhodomonas_salina.1
MTWNGLEYSCSTHRTSAFPPGYPRLARGITPQPLASKQDCVFKRVRASRQITVFFFCCCSFGFCFGVEAEANLRVGHSLVLERDRVVDVGGVELEEAVLREARQSERKARVGYCEGEGWGWER